MENKGKLGRSDAASERDAKRPRGTSLFFGTRGQEGAPVERNREKKN